MYYIYRQNNSGGYLIENDDVGSYVVVEEISQRKAQLKMEEIIVGYNDFCTCCGERWSPEFPKEIDSVEEFTTVMRFWVNDMEHRRFYAQVTVQDKNTKEIKDLALDLVIPYRMDNKGCLRGHWYTLDEEAINGDFIPLAVWQFDTMDSILLALYKTVNMSIPILSERKKVLEHNRHIFKQSKQDIEDIVHGN